MLDRIEREKLLRNDWGVPQRTLASTLRSIKAAQSRRWQTNNNLKYSRIEEKWQGAVNKVKKMIGMRKGTEEQIESLWERPDLKKIFNNRRQQAISAESEHHSYDKSTQSGSFFSDADDTDAYQDMDVYKEFDFVESGLKSILKKSNPSSVSSNPNIKKTTTSSSTTRDLKGYDLVSKDYVKNGGVTPSKTISSSPTSKKTTTSDFKMYDLSKDNVKI